MTTTAPQHVPVCVASPTGPKPPRLVPGPGVHEHDIQAGNSDRVIVELENRSADNRARFFGRYSYVLEEWLVDGCSGGFHITRWWPMPAGPGYEQEPRSSKAS